jgi:hypothetical protein
LFYKRLLKVFYKKEEGWKEGKGQEGRRREERRKQREKGEQKSILLIAHSTMKSLMEECIDEDSSQ